MRKFMIAAVALVVLSVAAGAAQYEIDTAHSQIGFKVKHVTGKVSGRFTSFSGSFNYDQKSDKFWSAEAKIDPASINTDNEARDKHLKSPDFFDVAKSTGMAFKSTEITDHKDDHAKLHGLLTLHGQTKPVVLDLQVGGVDKDPWGNETAGFTATGTINRKEWGIVFNKTLDSGGLLVGEKVEIILEISGNVKK